MSTRYERQKYIDIAIGDVDQTTHPICQLKFDGIWCLCELDQSGMARYFSRNGELKKTEKLNTQLPPGAYVGELMYGSEWSKEQNRSGKFFCFDLVEDAYGDLRTMPYIDRYFKVLQFSSTGILPRHWHLVPNYPTSSSLEMWNVLVATEKFEGLVFRSEKDLWARPLLRSKWELTEDLYIAGYEEGAGRLKGSLGAVLCTRSPLGIGQHITIGGGFTDQMRKRIWSDRSGHLGKCLTVTAKKKFKSGLLRHPNFKEWHHEK